MNDKHWIRKYDVINSIADLRLERGLSQERLGQAIGLSRNAISSIETGAAYPTIRTAFVLADFFGKKVDEIFSLVEAAGGYHD